MIEYHQNRGANTPHEYMYSTGYVCRPVTYSIDKLEQTQYLDYRKALLPRWIQGFTDIIGYNLQMQTI